MAVLDLFLLHLQGALEEVNDRKQNFAMSVCYLERQVEKGSVCNRSHVAKPNSISPSLSPRNLSTFLAHLQACLSPPSPWSGNEPNRRKPRSVECCPQEFLKSFPSSPPTSAKAQEKLPGILRPGMELPDVVLDLSAAVDADTTAVINAYYSEMRSRLEHLKSCNGPDYKRNHRPPSVSKACSFKINTFTVCSMAAYTAAILHA
jgi:hypothetical protein